MMSSRSPEYYEGDRALPVFAKISSFRKRLLSVEDTVVCLLHPVHNLSYLCQKTPVTVNHNTIFLVDCNKLEDKRDIESDDLGVWWNNRVDTTVISVQRNSKRVTKVVKCGRNAKGSSETVFNLKGVYRVHGTDKSFRKITAYVLGE